MWMTSFIFHLAQVGPNYKITPEILYINDCLKWVNNFFIFLFFIINVCPFIGGFFFLSLASLINLIYCLLLFCQLEMQEPALRGRLASPHPPPGAGFLVFPGVYQWKLGIFQPLGLWSFCFLRLVSGCGCFPPSFELWSFFLSVCFLFFVFSGRNYTSNWLRGEVVLWCL